MAELVKKLWWISPWKLLAFFIFPAYAIICSASAWIPLDRLGIKYENFLSLEMMVLGGGLIFCVAVGAMFGNLLNVRKREKLLVVRGSPITLPTFVLDLIGILTILAYFIWYYEVLLDPNLFLNILAGARGASFLLREEVHTIPGITTMTQFGVPYVIFYLFNRYVGPGDPPRLRHKLMFWTILLLAAFRSIAWSERLALIEVLVPILVMYATFAFPRKSHFLQTILRGGPYVGILLLLPFFGVFEFFRSWLSAYSESEDSFLAFAFGRLVAYYLTALNNGAGLLSVTSWPTFTGEFLLRWLYKIPLLGDGIRGALDVKFQYEGFLLTYADPEFNNPSGIFVYFADLGIALALASALLYGLLLGVLYKGFIAKRPGSVILFPLFFISLLEIFRLPYLVDSRVTPMLLASFLAILFLRKRRDGATEKPDGQAQSR